MWFESNLGKDWEAAFIFIGTSQPKPSNSERFGLGSSHNTLTPLAATDELAGSKESSADLW